MDLVRKLANTENTQSSLQRSTVDKAFQQNQVIIANGNIKIRDMPIVARNIDISASDAWIIGDPVYGVIGVAGGRKFRGPSYLDTNYGTTVKVVNPNNVFNFFGTHAKEVEYFVDSTTNCTIDSTNITFTFLTTQKLVLLVYLDSATITEFRTNISNDVFDDVANYTFELSADGKSHWQTVINGTWTIPNFSGNNIYLRITNTGGGVISLRNSVTGKKLPIRVEYR